MPMIPAWRISFATVFADTRSPASARSARIRGDEYTWSDAAWKSMIFPVSSVRRCSAGLGPAAWRRAQS